MSFAPERSALALGVERHFSFLSVHGFTPRWCLDGVASFRRPEFELDIQLDPRTAELSLTVSHGDHRLWLENFIDASDRPHPGRYRCSIARDPVSLLRGLRRMAHLLQRHAAPVLRGDVDYFRDVVEATNARVRAEVRSINDESYRKRAYAAFRERRYGEVVRLLEESVQRLTPLDEGKLRFARKHCEGS